MELKSEVVFDVDFFYIKCNIGIPRIDGSENEKTAQPWRSTKVVAL
jgi:hypothetical protein